MQRWDSNLSYEGSRREFLEIAAQFDAPAFIRRAKRTEEAAESVIINAQGHRDQLLDLARTRLGILAALLDGEWPRLSAFIKEDTRQESDTVEWLRQLYQQWQPELRAPPQATLSPQKIRRALDDLVSSFERFNQRWASYVDAYDFCYVNQVREDYNNYYVVEKACAFDSERIGQEGFEPLPPMKPADIIDRLPLLRIPSVV